MLKRNIDRLTGLEFHLDRVRGTEVTTMSPKIRAQKIAALLARWALTLTPEDRDDILLAADLLRIEHPEPSARVRRRLLSREDTAPDPGDRGAVQKFFKNSLIERLADLAPEDAAAFMATE